MRAARWIAFGCLALAACGVALPWLSVTGTALLGAAFACLALPAGRSLGRGSQLATAVPEPEHLVDLPGLTLAQLRASQGEDSVARTRGA